MGSFETSSGDRLSKSKIDPRIKKAKDEFKEDAIYNGKSYCWACGTTGKPRSASHIISVNACQNDGMVEFAWDKKNLQLECHDCHIQTEIKNFSHHANYLYKKEFIELYKHLLECKKKK